MARLRFAYALMLLMIGSSLAEAQPAPNINQSQVYGAWTQTARAPDISVTTSTQDVVLGASAPVALIYNDGTAFAYVKPFKTATTVTALAGIPVPPGGCTAVNVSGQAHLAAIGAGSTTLHVSLGSGSPVQCMAAGSGGSGGGGAVTNAGTFAVQNTAATPAGTNVIGSVNQGTSPWVVNTTQWNSVALGSPTTWGTAPTGNAVIGANANVLASVLPTGAATSANQITGSQPGNSANFVKGTTAAMTGTTSTQLIAAVTSNKIYLTDLTCGNSSATGTQVNVQDGSAGTTIWSLPASATYGGATIRFATPIATTSGNGVYVVDGTTGASVICSGSGFASTT